MTHILNERVLTRYDCPLHYWVTNKPTKYWIVFLHSAACDHRLFSYQLEVIPDYYNVLLLDIRGHGTSQPIGKTYSFDMVIEDSITIMDEVGCKQATLIGHSFGGNIAQEIAFRYPSRVKKMVLIDSLCTIKKLRPLEKLKFALMHILIKLSPWKVLLNSNAWVCSLYKQNREYVKTCYEVIGRKSFEKVFIETKKCFHYEKSYKVHIPILFLCGKYDKTLKINKEIVAFRKIAPNFNPIIIKGAAHNSNQDSPEQVNSLILEFLNS